MVDLGERRLWQKQTSSLQGSIVNCFLTEAKPQGLAWSKTPHNPGAA